MDDEQKLNQAIAAQLTTAVHVYILSMQLKGITVSREEAIEAVEATYSDILKRGRTVLSLPALQNEQTEITLPPTVTDASHPLTELYGGTSQLKVASPTESLTQKPAVPIAQEKTRSLSTGGLIDNRYQVLRRLGAGGMGEVFLGEQLNTKRRVAIKVMQAQAVGQSEESLNFFRQEAEALARLNHPSIAQVYDASVSGNDLYIAMEYIEGESLRDKLRREGALPLGEAVRILREACIGLDTAHRLGIIHRDMKPENLMLVREELGCIKVKILDFGLAILDNKDAMENITGAGMITGTPSYMSPEQIRGLTVTPATDVYSLGVIGYEMLTGKNPFEGKEMTQVMYNHVYVSPPSIRSVVPKVPQELEEVLMRALEKDPQNRYATAGEFAHAL